MSRVALSILLSVQTLASAASSVPMLRGKEALSLRQVLTNPRAKTYARVREVEVVNSEGSVTAEGTELTQRANLVLKKDANNQLIPSQLALWVEQADCQMNLPPKGQKTRYSCTVLDMLDGRAARYLPDDSFWDLSPAERAWRLLGKAGIPSIRNERDPAVGSTMHKTASSIICSGNRRNATADSYSCSMR